MSKNSFNIEIIYKTTTALLKSVPASIESLREAVATELHISGVVFKYMDEEGDLITLSTTNELFESYQLLSDLQVDSFKILAVPGQDFMELPGLEERLSLMQIDDVPKPETVWHNVQCDGCGDNPITGNRFKCTVCSNYDCCEFCEMSSQHPHPFRKLTTLDQAVTPIRTGPFVKAVVEKKPKMRFVKHLNYLEGECVGVSEAIQKRWQVKNVGNDSWPAGCKAEYAEGELRGYGHELHAVKSGEVVDLCASISAPSRGGRYTAVWRLVNKDGVSFGDKLYIVVNVSERDADEKMVRDLMNFGFKLEDAQNALKTHFNDFQAALKHLVNN